MNLDPHKKSQLLDLLQELWENVNEMPVKKSCLTCVFFASPVCKKWDSNPPQEVIAAGCEDYEFDKQSPPF